MACVVPGCKSHSGNARREIRKISFHRFPVHPELCQKWVYNLRRPDWSPTKASKVCSLHFEDVCYRNTEKKLLHSYAVPTIFPNQSAYIRQKITKKRQPIRRVPSDPVASTSQRVLYEGEPFKTMLDENIIPKEVPTAESSRYSGDKKNKVPRKNKPVIDDLSASRAELGEEIHPKKLGSSNAENIMSDKENMVPRNQESLSPIYKLNEKIRQLESKLAHQVMLAERRKRSLKKWQKKCSRLSKKAITLAEILKELKQKVEREHISILENCVDCPGQIFSRYAMKLEGSSLPKEYEDHIKKFAVTLQFLSPRAYDYVRNTFNQILPHPKTISKWYQSLDCNPGFTKESFEIIKSRCTEKTLYCALSMDEMAIRKQLQWDGKQYYGQISIHSQDDDSLPLASEAIVFMVTCINEAWKIPVGYFFINGLTGAQKANLVEQCITLLNETGVKTISLTFDGAAANASMATELGCDLNPSNLKTTFRVGDQEVAILYDPCHNIKLLRNALGEKKVFLDEKNQTVDWQYIELLQDLQTKEGLRAANKLTAAHINFRKQKMKVKLATQLLSNSVADSLQYCKDMNLPEYQNCDATIKFIRNFNDLFDILNSRNMSAKGLKKPLCDFNIERIRSKLKEIDNYIDSLKTSDGSSLLYSRRKTGFLGMKICIQSILSIFDKYVKLDPSFSFLPTHKLSQDHVEIFFAAIRSLGGYNNNPSAKAFITAYKKFLVHAEFKISRNANCLPLENITILQAKSTKPRFVESINETSERSKMLDAEDLEVDVNDNDHDYVMAGFIARKLGKKIVCEKCNNLLTSEGPNKHSLLVDVKNKGGLIHASSQVAAICKFSEKVLRRHIKLKGANTIGTKNNYLKISNEIFALCGNLFQSSDHCHDHEAMNNHIHLLIKAVIITI